MSPKKGKNINNTDGNATDNDVENLLTDSEVSNSLRQELREAINTMGPDTPHSLGEKLSELEENLNSERELKTSLPYKIMECKCKSAPVEVQELYKKNLVPATDESHTESVDVENVETSKSYNEDLSFMVCPKDELIDEKNAQPRIMNKCHCLNENFVTIRRNPAPQEKKRSSRLDRHSITKWIRNSFSKKDTEKDKQSPEFYKMFVTQDEDDHSPPRKLVFSLIDELPKPECCNVGVNTRPHVSQSKEDKDRRNHRARGGNVEDRNFDDQDFFIRRNDAVRYNKGCRCGIPARVDVYYFDHGNASYLRTTDNPPLIRSEIVADQSEECNIKFWGEIFGTVHIGTSFVTSFILQLFRFLLHSIIRPLTIGLLQISSDYFFKPCLATFFNAIIQPPLICCYNICTSLRDICDPIAEGIGYFIREIAVLFRSCRLIDIKTSKPCDHSYTKNNI